MAAKLLMWISSEFYIKKIGNKIFTAMGFNLKRLKILDRNKGNLEENPDHLKCIDFYYTKFDNLNF